jgi:uncharacterized membrane protein
MAIAVLALVGLLVSVYLALHNLGYLGILQCSTGGCLTVQSSAYAWFPPRTLTDAGIPVSVMGVAAYALLLAIAIAGLQPRWMEARWVARALAAVSFGGVLFSGYLTYLEAYVIHAWCQWCVISAILVTCIFFCSLPGLRGSGERAG